MKFALILIALAQGLPGTGAGQIHSVGPLTLGTFPNLAACQKAAAGTHIEFAGQLPTAMAPFSGAQFLCVQIE